MSGMQRVFNYARTNPAVVYIAGGLVLNFVRSYSVAQAYQQNFAKYDVERKAELEAFLTTHKQ